MNKHLQYLRYLVRHKWFVAIGCFKRGLYWQGIVHDWSKFLPSEWFPYTESFYGRGKFLRDTIKMGYQLNFDADRELSVISDAFDRAWLLHQHRNPHHWQHWILREDSGKVTALEMPERYRLEMLADWEGAGRAITGKTGGTPKWYEANRHRMQFHNTTLQLVDAALGYKESDDCPF